MDTMIHDRICPVYPTGPRIMSAVVIMAAHDADAIGGPYGLRRDETLESQNDQGAAVRLNTLARTVEPSMMAFFLPTSAQSS
ncbi:hypothetical protein RA307_01325 [Xanthobacteraceae bacterium Astr-EGSB]|uniref:hypothetical protein n=1 Tax=Astrobacterium formosum TaxID=3069710 RepID=UPI0027AED1AB|nr:hypothetical protein [Xanthobacteraceae bacterium Astr-EGSB]